MCIVLIIWGGSQPPPLVLPHPLPPQEAHQFLPVLHPKFGIHLARKVPHTTLVQVNMIRYLRQTKRRIGQQVRYFGLTFGQSGLVDRIAAADRPMMPVGIPVERAYGTDRARRMAEMEVPLPVIVRKALRQAERTPHARNGQISQINAPECPYRGILATQHPLEDAVGRLELPLIVQGHFPDVLLREPVPTPPVRPDFHCLSVLEPDAYSPVIPSPYALPSFHRTQMKCVNVLLFQDR